MPAIKKPYARPSKPLPPPPHVRLFSDVTNPQPSLSPASQDPAEREPEPLLSPRAVPASSLTAAAVLGMLVGLGRRHYTMWQPLNATAHPIIGDRADNVLGFQANVTLPGVAVVLVVSVMAGVIATALTSSRRTLHCAMTAFGVALAGYVVHLNIVARTPGGLATLLQVGELRAVYAAGAIALFAGMRYALPLDATSSPTV